MTRRDDEWGYEQDSIQEQIEYFFDNIVKYNIWTTKIWDDIDIDEMDITHRQNIIKLMLRKKDLYLQYVSKEYYNNIIKILSYNPETKCTITT